MEIYNDTYCVYIHTNKINNKKYVGYTVHGDNPNAGRWLNGLGYLKRNGSGEGDRTHFANAIKGHGWDNFEHEIVASNLTKDEATNFEKLLISALGTHNRDIGYNMTTGGDGGSGVVFSDERIEECRQRWLAYFSDPENKQKHFDSLRKSEVLQFSETGVFIDKYISINEAHRQTGVSCGGIIGCANQKIPSAGGYIWLYPDDICDLQERVYQYSIRKSHREPIVQMTLDHVFVQQWENAKIASIETGINHGNINSVCRGNRKQAGGFIWMYLSDYYNMFS